METLSAVPVRKINVRDLPPPVSGRMEDSCTCFLKAVTKRKRVAFVCVGMIC